MDDMEYLRREADNLRNQLHKEREEYKELDSKKTTATAVAVFLGFACFIMLYTLLQFQSKIQDLNREVTYYQELCDEYNEAP